MFGKMAQCILVVALLVAGFSPSAYAAAMDYLGAWSSSTTYAVGKVVKHNGGIFYITRNFLSFLTLLNDSEPESVVLLDDREVPILIDNFSEFRNSAIQKYFRVTNQYYLDFEAIRKKRTVKDLVDL